MAQPLWLLSVHTPEPSHEASVYLLPLTLEGVGCGNHPGERLADTKTDRQGHRCDSAVTVAPRCLRTRA